jgi:hypothetical protein
MMPVDTEPAVVVVRPLRPSGAVFEPRHICVTMVLYRRATVEKLRTPQRCRSARSHPAGHGAGQNAGRRSALNRASTEATICPPTISQTAARCVSPHFCQEDSSESSGPLPGDLCLLPDGGPMSRESSSRPIFRLLANIGCAVWSLFQSRPFLGVITCSVPFTSSGVQRSRLRNRLCCVSQRYERPVIFAVANRQSFRHTLLTGLTEGHHDRNRPRRAVALTGDNTRWHRLGSTAGLLGWDIISLGQCPALVWLRCPPCGGTKGRSARSLLPANHRTRVSPSRSWTQ